MASRNFGETGIHGRSVKKNLHHRDTEFTEIAQRKPALLCAPSVNSVSLW
jgi:hypothetical protein